MVALQVSSWVPSAVMAWSVACVMFAPIVFLVVQMERVERTRVVLALLVALAVAGVGIYAQTPLNACMGIERYSPEWWAIGCWYLDLLRILG